MIRPLAISMTVMLSVVSAASSARSQGAILESMDQLKDRPVTPGFRGPLPSRIALGDAPAGARPGADVDLHIMGFDIRSGVPGRTTQRTRAGPDAQSSVYLQQDCRRPFLQRGHATLDDA
jgi:hypothetical protein